MFNIYPKYRRRQGGRKKGEEDERNEEGIILDRILKRAE